MAEWAKLHTDILADPKLMRAARKGARWLLHLPWLIAFAKRADDSGRLTVNGEPAEAEDYLQSIPCTTEKAVTLALDELEKLGILVRELGGALAFSAWGKRQQAPSESHEAVRERVKRHRAARKSNKITKGVTSGNEAPTFQRNDAEGEEEGEEEVRRAVTAGTSGNDTNLDDATYRADPFIDAFRDIRQGIPPAGIVAKVCKAVVAEVGMAETLHRWTRFLAERRHSPPAYFAQEHGQYAGIGAARPPPEVAPEDHWHEPPTDPDEIARLKAHGFR